MEKSLSRKKGHRRSLLRNLATSLILYEEIKTTKAKAKAVKPIVEHLISLAKKNDLNSRRRMLSYFFDKNTTRKMFDILVPRFKNIDSGFVSIYAVGPRLGDSASMVVLKLKEKKSTESDNTKLAKESDEEKGKKAGHSRKTGTKR